MPATTLHACYAMPAITSCASAMLSMRCPRSAYALAVCCDARLCPGVAKSTTPKAVSYQHKHLEVSRANGSIFGTDFAGGQGGDVHMVLDKERKQTTLMHAAQVRPQCCEIESHKKPCCDY
eukprot:1359046-Rhodomonas_salina.1